MDSASDKYTNDKFSIIYFFSLFHLWVSFSFGSILGKSHSYYLGFLSIHYLQNHPRTMDLILCINVFYWLDVSLSFWKSDLDDVR